MSQQQIETKDIESQSDSYSYSNNSNDISSTSSKPTEPKIAFTFGKCKICTDTATGVHYGVATCEGCKVKKKNSVAINYLSILIKN